MKINRDVAEQLFQKTLGAITGLDPDINAPLGGVSVKDTPEGSSLPRVIVDFH